MDKKKMRVELHAYTSYSYLEGIEPPDGLVEGLKEKGCCAVAITDRHGIQGHPEAYNAAKEHPDVKVIYGVEVDVTEFTGQVVSELKNGVNKKCQRKKCNVRPASILILNEQGRVSLNRMLTEAYLKYNLSDPVIPKEVLVKYRQGLLVGLSCNQSAFIEAVLEGKADDELKEWISFYDYIEIQPIENVQSMLEHKEKKATRESLQKVMCRIVSLGEACGKPVVAVSNMHYINKEDALIREIVREDRREDPEDERHSFYLRTSEEILWEFAYLGEKMAQKVVFDNPWKIADRIEPISPIPKREIFLQKEDIKGVEKLKSTEELHEHIKSECNNRVKELYGEGVSEDIRKRLYEELDWIKKQHNEGLYLVMQRLVKELQARSKYYRFRGDITSSFVAYLLGILDEAPTDCSCSEKELLGINGECNLNIVVEFSAEDFYWIQNNLQKIIGEGRVFHVGTTGNFSTVTAARCLYKYKKNHEVQLSQMMEKYVKDKISRMKRAYGCLSGKMILMPAEEEILEYTPLQEIYLSEERDIPTTHFGYDFIADKLPIITCLGSSDGSVFPCSGRGQE